MTTRFRLLSTPAAALVAAFGASSGLAAEEACAAFPVGAESHSCSCAPGAGGSVWGSGPYTSDSSICAAARHAGAIGEAGGPVTAVAAPGAASYAGSIQNGITSRDWGSYPTSFEILPPAPDIAECGRFPEDEAGVTCFCAPGAETGSVWGSDPYTVDSDICSAAIHAALIDHDGGVVTVLRVMGLERYSGSEFNGISTRDWGSYSSSFTFDYN